MSFLKIGRVFVASKACLNMVRTNGQSQMLAIRPISLSSRYYQEQKQQQQQQQSSQDGQKGGKKKWVILGLLLAAGALIYAIAKADCDCADCKGAGGKQAEGAAVEAK